jgi:hypothetical protein
VAADATVEKLGGEEQLRTEATGVVHVFTFLFNPVLHGTLCCMAQWLKTVIYNEIGKSCMTVAVKACAKKKDAKSDMK